MLQRAASNAYSWWWASHIRTKQSKWLEQSLQDMEEKTQGMLKLIEEDGDSFAKRAEMYYKRRPELINSVEEAYKVFRALADRYDHLSKELQNANHTIATVFPEQVPFMGDDEDSPTPRIPRDSQMPAMNMGSVPNVPKAPSKDFKGLLSPAVPKQFLAKKSAKSSESHNKVVAKSGLNKDEALEEMDKLQKNILALQTGKEFVKSSYESSLSKFWDIENQIMEMQQKVCLLQDEFNVDRIIEDDEARSLMAEAALKSCQETLNLLQEKQEKSTREAREEYKKIEAASLRLESLKQKLLHGKTEEEKTSEGEQMVKVGGGEETSVKNVGDVIQATEKVELLKEKSKENLNLNSVSSLTMTELAEKIDELVNKVISLETAMSSQTVLISTLRTDTDDLHEQIRNLEDEKDTLIDDTQNLSSRVKQLEEKLTKVHDLNKNVESQNSNLQTNFAEARSNLENLSEKLSNVKPDEEVEEVSSSKDNTNPPSEGKLQEVFKDKKDLPSLADGGVESSRASKTEDIKDVKEVDLNIVQVSESSVPKQGEVKQTTKSTVTFLDPKLKEEVHVDHRDNPVDAEAQGKTEKEEEIPKQGEVKRTTKSTVTFLDPKPKEEVPMDPRDNPVNAEAQGKTEKEEELNWQQMLLSGMEDPDKVLLKEYNTLLKNYKEVKKKLHEMEKKERDSEFEITLQIRELKKAILKRDEEIQHLRQRLMNLTQDVKGENASALSESRGDSGIEAKAASEDSKVKEFSDIPVADEEDDTKLVFIDTTSSVSIVEEKFRLEIDAILEENLDFWLRFSTTFHQIQKFKTEVQDLQDEISKQKEKKKQEGSTTTQIKSDVRPIYKHLMEIQTELTVWLEQSASLKDELKRRFASLCGIQEEITKALKEGVEEDEIRFSSHQAAKFQGEILNMKHENNKVREELQAGSDHVRTLQMEIEKTVRMLNEEFGISSDQPQLKQSMSQNRVPLRSFIFGTKPKKQKYSIFSSNRRYQNLKSGPL